MEDSYSVVFTCEIQPDAETSEVIKNIANLFKTTEEKAKALLSSRKQRVLKKNLSYDMALQYKKKLTEAGLQIEIRDETLKSPPLSPKPDSHQKKTATPLHPPAAASAQMEKNVTQSSRASGKNSSPTPPDTDSNKTENQNVYAPPQANLIDKNLNSETDSLLHDLKYRSTWSLLLLTVVTLGVYSAHYVRRQSMVINTYLGEDEQISPVFYNIILVSSYILLILILLYVSVLQNDSLDLASDICSRGSNILLLIWAFMARKKMNSLLSAVKGGDYWFHGFWTFFFQHLYFNYKINKITASQNSSSQESI
ncbi:hypothetical protein [Desulfogranum japonicum]|uniref:hypothetical protein n=1 Tax=Desulfogranum japonicum TaxID=231447 RepID=UPI000410567F|nr:hypothetical protein [Desulfogranum japonicum]